MARFRISCHGLRIETGRWGRPPIPRELRFCNHCASGVVDDESHLLFDCSAHAAKRLKLKIKLQRTCMEGFQAFNDQDLNALFNEHNALPLLASYIYQAMRERKELESLRS
jgi:hypothetical protein